MQTSFLTSQLQSDLQQIKRASDLSLIIHHSTIKLALLEKKQVFFLTDGHVIIQGQVCSFSQRHEKPTPFNRIRTDYYNFNTKHANLFIFNGEDQAALDLAYPSAYEPKFHFQERMGNYNPTSALNQFRNVTEILQVTQWGFKMVNIANSGYYGVVLDIYKYERLREKYSIDINIHSILYQKCLVEALEDFRIRDMRQQVGEPNRINPISLCYYRKNLKTTHVNKTLQSNFVTADRAGKLLKVNLLQRQHYLPLGKLSGVLRFLRPLANFSQCKKPLINFNLFRELPENSLHNKSESQSSESDSSQSSSSQQEAGEMATSAQQIDSSEESSEEEEPLKMIYLKQLRGLNIQ